MPNFSLFKGSWCNLKDESKRRFNLISNGLATIKLATTAVKGALYAADKVNQVSNTIKDNIPEIKMPDIKMPFRKEPIDEEVASIVEAFKKLDRSKQVTTLVEITKIMKP